MAAPLREGLACASTSQTRQQNSRSPPPPVLDPVTLCLPPAITPAPPEPPTSPIATCCVSRGRQATEEAIRWCRGVKYSTDEVHWF
mmetsp:Transcript_13472/g.19031  ORF Transcript_13472/g.19031 Transcript_13472/m.19031 type:complete len:86 (-) Transcript_13472:89-346(-)